MFTSTQLTLDGAQALDAADPLRHLCNEFLIPTKAEIASTCLEEKGNTAAKPEASPVKEEKCIYLCGNSLGLQPRRTGERIRQYLSTWATQGVQGHFKPLSNSPLPIWLDVDERAAQMIAPIVGAKKEEVAVMQTLTANLHLLMSAFYHPDVNGRHKILLEGKAFPSDHFAVESQIRNRGLDPSTSLVTISSLSSTSSNVSTYDICAAISAHAKDTALLLLPGVQYYTGQLFDIPTITAFAHKHDIFVVWDLAHAAGNVPLKLHDWDVDAAAWCSYKYLNSGPGCIGGLFVHERVSRAGNSTDDHEEENLHRGTEDVPKPRRLGGWWGNQKSTRFAMDTEPGFIPVSGASGFQLSNPSVLDTTALCASLEVFEQAGGMSVLREKSLKTTAYLEALLESTEAYKSSRFIIITPRDPEQRGSQLSLLLAEKTEGEKEGKLLERVMEVLGWKGVVVDERKPNVIRVAPAPLYNSFEDVYRFVEAFGEALTACK